MASTRKKTILYVTIRLKSLYAYTAPYMNAYKTGFSLFASESGVT